MPCFHKFFGHPAHMADANGLLPDWDADTLIIGTFNPELTWNIQNDAEYFYGRRKNYFWRALPRFACHDEIHRLDVVNQIGFLTENRIALTDLLISVNDADVNIEQHLLWIRRFLDNDLLNFGDFTWNTRQIIEYITGNEIKKIYFTRSLFYNDLFDIQLAEIEHQTGKTIYRLHTPSGQGLGAGVPRKNKLIHRWYPQGGSQFPFLCTNFTLNNFPWL